jgi:hypothetical protein
MSVPSGRWSISFATSQDWDDGKRSSGFLVFWSSKNWLALLNDLEDPLVGTSIDNGETIHIGSIVRFNSLIAKVQECILRWNALCSSFVNGDWSSQRSTVLLLRPIAKRLVLFDQDGVLIDARFLLEGEQVSTGVAIEMPVHKVIVGNLIEEKVRSKQSQNPSLDAISQVLPPSLDFSKGKNFESEIRRKFGHSVNFVPGFRKREFYLVASFGRANFKLNYHSVSLALQSCFGGMAAQFHVKTCKEECFNSLSHLERWVLRFTIPIFFSEKDFDLYVHLWGNGGPN